MAIVLKANNQELLINAKHSYLSTNYSAGVTTLIVVNGDGFAVDDYLLLGEFGNESSEIVQVSGVATHSLTVGNTKFAHSESTKVTILPYNKVRFYHTTTTAFSALVQVGSDTDIQADSLSTIISDTTYTTGYGWFCFYNSTTLAITQNSNYIPYTGFASNSVRKIIEDFYSQLTVTEQKLVSTSEILSWLSEAYSVAKGELNLVNKEFSAEDHYDLAVTANLAEYSLPDNLDYILSVYDDDNDEELDRINIKDIDKNNESTDNATKYYIRGIYLGFSPTPDAAGNFIVRYTTKPADVTSYSDLIVLPGNNHYILKDYIMFRASSRLKRPDGANFLASFYKGIERIKLIANRGGGESSWSIDEHASV